MKKWPLLSPEVKHDSTAFLGHILQLKICFHSVGGNTSADIVKRWADRIF